MSPRSRVRAGWGVTLVVLLHAVLATYGIDQDVGVGHAGFHIGEYGTQAVHLRRHGLWVPSEANEFRVPGVGEREVRHGFVLHPFIALSQAVFGERPWTARLVPCIFSSLTLVGLWRLVRRLRGDAAALWAAASFALHPIVLGFSHLPEYQFLALAFALPCLEAIVRHAEAPTARSLWTWWAFAALAAASDWPWFEVSVFVLAVLAREAWRARGAGDVARARALVVGMTGHGAVLVLVLAAHVAAAASVGALGSLREAAQSRTTGLAADYAGLVAGRLTVLHTTERLVMACLGVAAAWRTRDLGTRLVLALIGGALLDLLLFPGSMRFHEYRGSVWLVPGITYFAVEAFRRWEIAASLRRAGGRRPLGEEVVRVALAASLVSQAGTAWVRSRERRGSLSHPGMSALARTREPFFVAARVAHVLSEPNDTVIVSPAFGDEPSVAWLLARDAVRSDTAALAEQSRFRRQPYLAVLPGQAVALDRRWRELAQVSRTLLLRERGVDTTIALVVGAPGLPPGVESLQLRRGRVGLARAWLTASWDEVLLSPGEAADCASFTRVVHAGVQPSVRWREGGAALSGRLPMDVRSRGDR